MDRPCDPFIIPRRFAIGSTPFPDFCAPPITTACIHPSTGAGRACLPGTIRKPTLRDSRICRHPQDLSVDGADLQRQCLVAELDRSVHARTGPEIPHDLRFRRPPHSGPDLVAPRLGAELLAFFSARRRKGRDRRPARAFPDIPFLLSRGQCDVPFIKQALDLGLLGDRDLIVQEPGEVIAADRVFVIRPPLHDRGYRDRVLDRLGHAGGDGTQSRRYFVTRGKSAENDRRLQNESAVIDALAPFGFETLDPQTLSLGEQMAAFAACGFMVSPHGAGLTNMIFRRGAPLDVVEIFNFNLINDCYEIAAKQHDFRYRALYCDQVVRQAEIGKRSGRRGGTGGRGAQDAGNLKRDRRTRFHPCLMHAAFNAKQTDCNTRHAGADKGWVTSVRLKKDLRGRSIRCQCRLERRFLRHRRDAANTLTIGNVAHLEVRGISDHSGPRRSRARTASVTSAY